MAPLDKQQSKGTTSTSAQIERAQLAAARWQAGFRAPASSAAETTEDEPWTACRAPSNVLVIDTDGSLRACDYGATESAPAQSPLTSWNGDTFASLRSELADSSLPLPHCSGCAQWCHDDLYASAPPIRDYGALPAEPAGDAPRNLVIRLPEDGNLPRPDLLQELDDLTGQLETLTLQGHDVFGNAAAAKIVATLRSSTGKVQLHVETQTVTDADSAVELVAALELAQVTLHLQSADSATLATAATIAERCKASLQVRFVFAPKTWFAFADIVQLAASHGATVNLHTLDHDGIVPLQQLDTVELGFLRSAVVDFWEAFNGSDRPASLGDNAFSNLCSELLQLERRQSELEPESGSESEPAQPDDEPAPALQLPPLDHDWCQGPDATRWQQRVFQHANTLAVVTWVEALDEDACREQSWLRTLCHRIAIEQQHPELLERLRRIYSHETGETLLQADQDFADAFDLTPFGGPWADRLGLTHQARQRPQPFAIGPSVSPDNDVAADITVLIPSYQHEQFIAGTIRSVLAQSHPDFALLVADDRSPDETVARASAIDDPRIRVQVNEQNLGLGNSVLQALDSITTPFVALLNSDDLLHPDHLKSCREALVNNPDAQLAVTDIQPIDSSDGELTCETVSLVLDGKQIFDWIHWFDRISPDQDVAPEQSFGELLRRNYLVTSSNLVVRTDWLRAQAESLRSLKYCLDWRLFLQAALEGALVHIRQPLVAYRLHASNTVWFDHERRDGYHLEVNRVATEAVQQWAARNATTDESQVAAVLEAVASHLNENDEADGFALFLNSVVDPLALDRNIANSSTCKALLAKLSAAADERRLGPEADSDSVARLANAKLDSQIQHQVADAERGRRRWLQVLTSQQAERIEEQQRLVDKIWAEKQTLEQHIKDVRADLEQRLQDTRESLEARIEKQTARSKQQEETRLYLSKELEEREARIKRKDERIQEESRAHRETYQKLQDTQSKLNTRNAELRQLGDQYKAAQAEIANLSAQLATTQEQVRDQQARITTLTQQRQQLETTLRGREFQIGNFIWNKLPLSWLAGRLKKWYRRVSDMRTRLSMRNLRRRAKRKGGLGTAIVSSTRVWPDYSHTFVYQEMLGFADAKLDLQLLYWDRGDQSKLHKAFHGLLGHSTQLQHHWGQHKRDYQHFAKTRPQRLRAFLERIATLRGTSPEQLANDGMILRACTFARMVELSGARYLHSYFFYDQSFMAMMAAELLDLPRGISCYADHMLDDYPWKFVPLQIELADVIVATSDRIKQELSQLSGGKHDDKILVKPNGVDGNRFPATSRQPHAAGEVFDVISISRIEPKKGLTYLVEAVAELQERGHKVNVHVIGSGDANSPGSIEYADEFRQRIEQLGMQQQIVLHGMLRQEEMAPILAKAHAFVAPYVETENGDKDGIPTAMLEAMASSLPIITTDSGSIQEVVSHDVEGLIVPQRQSTALADAIQQVMDNPALEQRMARAARERFEKQFDIRVTEQRLHDRITTVINERT